MNTLTPAQATTLRYAREDGQVSTASTNSRTLNALARKGLLKVRDRFPSGDTTYALTIAGRKAARAIGGVK